MTQLHEEELLKSALFHLVSAKNQLDRYVHEGFTAHTVKSGKAHLLFAQINGLVQYFIDDNPKIF